MTEEMLYYISADDEVLGSVSRSAAHSDPSIIHREVAVLLVDTSGRALMARRSMQKKVLPGKWEVSCAGHVPWGMSVEEAAHMELWEEIGFDTPLQKVGTQLAFYDWETHLTHLFVGKYSGEKVVLQESEVAGWDLLDLKGVRALEEGLSEEWREWIEMTLQDTLPQAPLRLKIDLRNPQEY